VKAAGVSVGVKLVSEQGNLSGVQALMGVGGVSVNRNQILKGTLSRASGVTGFDQFANVVTSISPTAMRQGGPGYMHINGDVLGSSSAKVKAGIIDTPMGRAVAGALNVGAARRNSTMVDFLQRL
jgi:hypothetical protein